MTAITFEPADFLADYVPDSSGRYTCWLHDAPGVGTFIATVYGGDVSDVTVQALTRAPEHDARYAEKHDNIGWLTARLSTDAEFDDVLYVDGLAYFATISSDVTAESIPSDESPLEFGEAFARVLSDQRESFTPAELDDVECVASVCRNDDAETIRAEWGEYAPEHPAYRLGLAYLMILSAKYSIADWGIHGPIEQTWGATDKGLDDGLWEFLTNIDDADEPSPLQLIAVPCGIDPRRCVASLDRLAAEGLVVESEQGWVGVVN